MGTGSAAPTRPAPTPAPPPSVEPLDADRARLHLTVSRRLLAKLEAAKAALSHSKPGASAEEVLEVALDALLAQRAKRKGIVEKPRPNCAGAGAAAADGPAREKVSAAVRREAWIRSGGACEWPLESGGRCGSTLRLELDHVLPRALGGPSTIDNLRIVCRFHNQLAARRALGDRVMNRYTREGRAAREPSRGVGMAKARPQDVSGSDGGETKGRRPGRWREAERCRVMCG